MTFSEYAEKLENCIKSQIALFSDYHKIEEKIKEYVAAKNWSELDKALSLIRQKAHEIETAEAERGAVFNAIKKRCGCADFDKDFCAFMQIHYPEKANVFDSLYKELKSNVRKVKMLTARIDAYLSTVTAAAAKMLDEAFPIRKGTIYNSQGIKGAAFAPPLVLDRQL